MWKQWIYVDCDAMGLWWCDVLKSVNSLLKSISKRNMCGQHPTSRLFTVFTRKTTGTRSLVLCVVLYPANVIIQFLDSHVIVFADFTLLLESGTISKIFVSSTFIRYLQCCNYHTLVTKSVLRIPKYIEIFRNRLKHVTLSMCFPLFLYMSSVFHMKISFPITSSFIIQNMLCTIV